MQEWAWQETGVREWGRTANYIVPPVRQENQNQNDPPQPQPAPVVPVVQGNGADGIGVAAQIAAVAEDEEMADAVDLGLSIEDLEQFQWP